MCRRPFLPTRCLLVLLILAGHLGCGVKGPPRPDQAPPLPAVTDLSYRLDAETATLTWRLTEPLPPGQADVATFDVYQSRSALSEPLCAGCPLAFEKVTAVPYTDAARNRFAAVLTLASGYRYVIEVRLRINGLFGDAAGPVRIDVPAEEVSREGKIP